MVHWVNWASPLIISTSLGIKETSSWTSRHGCRDSRRTRLPEPVKVFIRVSCFWEIGRRAFFNDFRFHISVCGMGGYMC